VNPTVITAQNNGEREGLAGRYYGGFYFDSSQDEGQEELNRKHTKSKSTKGSSGWFSFMNICRNEDDGGLNIALYFTIILIAFFNMVLLYCAATFWFKNPDLLKNRTASGDGYSYNHCIAY